MAQKTSVFRKITRLLEDNTLSKERHDFLYSIYEYIKSGDWEECKGQSERIIKTLGMNINDAIRETNMTVGAYKIMRKRMSDMIYKRIGEDTLDIVAYGDNDSFLNVYTDVKLILEGRDVCEYIQSDVLTLCDNGSKRDYVYDELIPEISFLKKHTRQQLLNDYYEYDEDKLAYLIDLLKGEKKTNDNTKRKLLLELLK